MSQPEKSSSNLLRLIRPVDQVSGRRLHRSGWRYAFAGLQELEGKDGILFDDHVEQSFTTGAFGEGFRYEEPWAGIFHQPPDVPAYTFPDDTPAALFRREAWKASRPHLRLAIALSRHLGDYLAGTLGVPVAVVRHPTERSPVDWSPEAYQANPEKLLLQFGLHLRNPRALHQVPPLPVHRKVRFWPIRGWAPAYDARMRTYWAQQGTRRAYGDVLERKLCSSPEYDLLLSRNVVLTEVFAASANNLVVECMARNTPLLINPHPAVVEYLGPDYPLYFDEPAHVPALLQEERVLAAHAYLAQMDKGWMHKAAFRDGVAAALRRV